MIPSVLVFIIRGIDETRTNGIIYHLSFTGYDSNLIRITNIASCRFIHFIHLSMFWLLFPDELYSLKTTGMDVTGIKPTSEMTRLMNSGGVTSYNTFNSFKLAWPRQLSKTRPLGLVEWRKAEEIRVSGSPISLYTMESICRWSENFRVSQHTITGLLAFLAKRATVAVPTLLKRAPLEKRPCAPKKTLLTSFMT